MGNIQGHISDSLSEKMHRLDTKQLVVKVKVEILTINELWSRFL